MDRSCWNATDLSTFDEPATLSGVGRDGVLVTGGEPSVYGVTSYCFGRHGFAVLGDTAPEGEPHMGQPDFWSIQNSFAYGNRGYGLYVNGGDSNAGESIATENYRQSAGRHLRSQRSGQHPYQPIKSHGQSQPSSRRR